MKIAASRKGVCSFSIFHEDLPLARLPVKHVWITLQVLIDCGLNYALHSMPCSLRGKPKELGIETWASPLPAYM